MFNTPNSRRMLLGAILSLAPARAMAQFQLKDAADFLKRPSGTANAPAGAALSQGDIGAGLKDAMKVASRRHRSARC